MNSVNNNNSSVVKTGVFQIFWYDLFGNCCGMWENSAELHY